MLKSELIKQLEELPDVPFEFIEFDYETGKTAQAFISGSVDKRVVFEKKKEGKTIAIVFALAKVK